MANNNVVGIVAEYNPFHNGHRYLIDEARRKAGADTVVCVMSGDYVQRGAPAITSKWTRADMALSNGVDVVVEIPVVYCLGNASFYASAGIRLLEGLGGVTHLAFGSESGDIDALRSVSDVIRYRSDELEPLIERYSKSGMSYPAARARSVREILSVNQAIPESPNDILGIEYLNAVRNLETLAIKRIGAAYHAGIEAGESVQSATAIREMIRNGADYASFTPEYSEDTVFYRNESKWFDLIRYKIKVSSVEELESAPGGGEGLGNRLKAVVDEAASLDDLITRVKSKRYTYTRISRWLYQILLGIDREMPYREPEYIRILGCSEKGREFLRRIRKEECCTLPVVTNIHQLDRDNDMLALDVRAADIYNLVTGQDMRSCSDYRQRPIMK